MEKRLDSIVASLGILIGLIGFAFGAFMAFDALKTDQKNLELNNKVEFYESVIEDLGLQEFVNYPEKWYNEDYIDQIGVHYCNNHFNCFENIGETEE